MKPPRRQGGSPTSNRSPSSLRLVALSVLATFLFGSGCQVTTEGERSTPADTIGDPTAERLHAICGELLIYYLKHQALPGSLDALRKSTSRPEALPPLVEPESGREFLYYRMPAAIPTRQGRLLILSPTRAAQSPPDRPLRWAVLVSKPQPGGQIITQVVLLSESEIQADSSGS